MHIGILQKHTRCTDKGSIRKYTTNETFVLLINSAHWLLYPICVLTADTLFNWNDFFLHKFCACYKMKIN